MKSTISIRMTEKPNCLQKFKIQIEFQGVAKVGYNGTLGSILLFFKRTFSKMLQINGTVPFLLMLCQHLVCAIFFSNVCAFCPIQECLCKKTQKMINITQWDKIYVCLGCLFGSVFKMSVWVVSVCLGVFSKCLFGLSLSVQRLDKVSNSGGAQLVKMPKIILFLSLFAEKCPLITQF